MLLETFNNADRETAIAAIRPCLDVPRWAQDIVEARPFADADALVDRARVAAEPFTTVEIDAALAHHPRIGERAAGNNAEARLSASEQAGLGDSSAEVEQALAQGNREYEAKFDRVFLIRAAGRDRGEILAELKRRMTLPEQQELQVIAGQLREIAIGRLHTIIQS